MNVRWFWVHSVIVSHTILVKNTNLELSLSLSSSFSVFRFATYKTVAQEPHTKCVLLAFRICVNLYESIERSRMRVVAPHARFMVAFGVRQHVYLYNRDLI